MNVSVFFSRAYTPESNVSMEKNCFAPKTPFQCLGALISSSTPSFIIYSNKTPQIAFDCSFPLF